MTGALLGGLPDDSDVTEPVPPVEEEPEAADIAVWLIDDNGCRDGELGEMYTPMFYDGDYAIHGSTSIPPFPASHGCARVSVARCPRKV